MAVGSTSEAEPTIRVAGCGGRMRQGCDDAASAFIKVGSGPRHDIAASGAFDRPLAAETATQCPTRQVSATDDARRGGALVRRGPGNPHVKVIAFRPKVKRRKAE